LWAGGAFFHWLRTSEPTPASFAGILLNWRFVLLPQRKVYDVLAAGSGASGGWVAKEVAERGLAVAMLEAGPRIPTREFTEHVCPYQLKFRGFGN
jgi:hypothetical protein